MGARLRTVLAGWGSVSEPWLAVMADRAELEVVAPAGELDRRSGDGFQI